MPSQKTITVGELIRALEALNESPFVNENTKVYVPHMGARVPIIKLLVTDGGAITTEWSLDG